MTAARHGEAEQFNVGEDVLAVGVADAGDRAAFHAASLGDEEGGREGAGGVFGLQDACYFRSLTFRPR